MTPLARSQIICLAICGFICAAASYTSSAFVVVQQPRHHQITSFSPWFRRHAAATNRNCSAKLPPHLSTRSAAKQDTADTSIGTSTSKININDEQTTTDLLLDQEKSIADINTSSRLPWKFKGYDVFYQVSQPKQQRSGAPVVLLVHGFGCSTVYWRETIQTLTNDGGYEVHAIDLLGQGKSAKPTTDDIVYSTNLWAEQIDTYARENLPAERDIVLIGNSVGSLVCLVAATGDFIDTTTDEGDDNNCDNYDYESSCCYIRQHVVGIGMFNCGIGMNIRNIVKDPKWNAVQRYMLNVTFDILETLVFGNIALLTWILDNVVTRDLLRSTLTELYKYAPNNAKDKIDDELVDSFYLPAKEAASPQVLSQILTNDAGCTPLELHVRHETFLKTLPIHLVWGDDDTVVPLKWQVGQFYTNLAEQQDNNNANSITMDVVHGAGHILFDEVPELSNGSMLNWLNNRKFVAAAKQQQ